MTLQNPRIIVIPIEDYFHILLRECPTFLHPWQQKEVFRQIFDAVDGTFAEFQQSLSDLPKMKLIFHVEQVAPWVAPFEELVRKLAIGIYLYCVENRLFDVEEVNGYQQWTFPYLIENIEPHYARLFRTEHS